MNSAESDKPLVSVIVVNWNGKAFLDECLSSLEKQTWARREFIVVDNGSSDGSADRIRAWTERLGNARGIYLSENTGFCRANNLGFTEARGEWIALLNNDAVADPNWLEELLAHRNAVAGLGMLGSKILFHDSPRMIDKVGHLMYWDGQNRGRGTMQEDLGQYDTPEEIIWPDACAAAYHRRLFEQTGGFDEAFFAFGDDADLGMRARLLGWRAWYVPTAVVYHRHSATAGVYSPLKVMLVERNRLLLAIKNFPLRLLLQNPYWMGLRFGWHLYAALQRQGSAGRFVQFNGPGRVLLTLAWSYLSAGKKLPQTLRKRRKIQHTKTLSDREVIDLLRRFQIGVGELALRD